MNAHSDVSLHAVMDSSSQVRHLPGDLAIWIFILAELTVFAALFMTFTIFKIQNPDIFAAGQATVHPVAGVINTIALISSSYLVALAVHRAENHNFKDCSRLLMAAMAVASVYLVTKGWEYQELFSQGFNLRTNVYYTLYFFITFFHFMHVLMGMVILGYVAQKAAKGGYHADDYIGVESGASYWHMVDMVWVVLFPLVYII